MPNIDNKTQEFIASMQMCIFLMNAASEVEKLGTKLNVPYYKVRERDGIIKTNLNNIYKNVLEEGEERCNESSIKLHKLLTNKGI